MTNPDTTVARLVDTFMRTKYQDMSEEEMFEFLEELYAEEQELIEWFRRSCDLNQIVAETVRRFQHPICVFDADQLILDMMEVIKERVSVALLAQTLMPDTYGKRRPTSSV